MKRSNGFQSPNHTQTPNDFFDMIPDMGDAELRVTLVMIRNTFGWHRDRFKMGVGKLAAAAGLSRQGALNGAEAAENRGTFRRTNPDAQGEAEWELVVNDTPLASRGAQASGGQPLQPVETPPLASRGQVATNKDKESKETLASGDFSQEEYNLLFRGDYRVYPEHLWEVAKALQTHWGFALPEKPKKARKGSGYSEFCDAMEQIKTAAAEFSAADLLKAVREDFVAYMKRNRGVAPFTVGKPFALVTSVTNKARELRLAQSAQQDQPYDYYNRPAKAF